MPMLMQNAIAKMIQKPCEANAGLEICISVFEPRSLPALAHYHPRSDSPERSANRTDSSRGELGPFHACRAVVFAKAGRAPHALHSANWARADWGFSIWGARAPRVLRQSGPDQR